jgi:SNF2 family DNA or RNA helicase
MLRRLGGALRKVRSVSYARFSCRSYKCHRSDNIDRCHDHSRLSKILPLWKKEGHRVLIFSQWTKMLDIIQRYVVSQGWKFLRLDGKTNVASRQRLVDTFNSDKGYFGMLCTTRTGGVGLNLTGADRLILYDPDWHVASRRRLHRLE